MDQQTNDLIKNEIDIQNDLREYFYKEESSIEQINVSKKKGKIVINKLVQFYYQKT